jgi:ABC-type multidrug transport system ATPase subunit/DNA-binding beta-propeller fold protein YncE
MRETLWLLEDVTLAGASRARLLGVSLRITRGVTGIAGASGAGKTSLLELLAGFVAPSEGRVAFLPEPRADAAPRLRHFWVPTDGALWPHLRALDQLALVHPEPGPAARAEAERLLEAFDLQAVAHERPPRLSHGQRQRLALARALATRAGVLLLDEPLVHVDEPRAQRCWQLLREHAAAHDVSLVLATHDHRVLRTADQVVLLEAGRVAATGAPAALAAALRIVVMLIALVLAACGGTAKPLAVQRVRHHAMPPCDTRVPAPRCIAPGEPGEWIVLDTAGRVLILSAAGAVVRQWFMPEHAVGRPEGACLLHDGRIVVADTHYHRLVWFDRTGRVLRMRGAEGRGPGDFIYPVRVIQDPHGFVYVAEYGSNDRVQKLTADGEPVLAFGRFGSAPGDLQRPSGLAWVDGEVFVADAMNGRIQVFGDDGTLRRALPQPGETLNLPYDVAVGAGGVLWVAEYGRGCVTELARDGAVRARFGTAGSGPRELATPWALAADGGRCLWIADTGNRRIVEVTL